uniref:Uncharacterized protein n=1 Tax=Rhizophora mucronata TaxID=61149 RepID=A0A2P2IHX0_RHIMU
MPKMLIFDARVRCMLFA